ncbi:MAG: site-specific integrase [Xanthobacteraceae bacterium]
MFRHEILGGLVKVYKREGTRHWHCSASIKGKRFRTTTKEEDLPQAQQFAEEWFLGLRGKSNAGLLKKPTKTFAEAAKQFLKEYETITEGQRSQKWIEGHGIRLRLHLLPYFGPLDLLEISPGKVQEYRVHRLTPSPVAAAPIIIQIDDGDRRRISRAWKAPSRSTLHDEIVTMRQVLKTAIRHGWLSHLHDFSPPYKTSGKIVHRPWFSPAEYRQLYLASRQYAEEMRGQRHEWNAAQVHDYILFMANTGLRPDEAKNLQHRDVTIAKDAATGERILEIEVRGKRGIGFCKSMPAAVQYYRRLLRRPKSLPQGRHGKSKDWENPNPPRIEYPQPNDHVFSGDHKKLFNGILKRAGLKVNRDGQRLVAYSLRHSYICFRLMEGADIYQIAKNCRTSVEMIEKFYAAHIKNTLDASQINVMRDRTKREREVMPNRRQPARSHGSQQTPSRRTPQRASVKSKAQK